MPKKKKGDKIVGTIPMNDGRGKIVDVPITEDVARSVFERVVAGPDRARRAFFESEPFDRLIDLFRAEVERRGAIDLDQVVYDRSGAYPFTADEFRQAFESVTTCVSDEHEDRSGLFPVYVTAYKGLEFAVMIGQGSAYIVRKPGAHII